MGNKSKLKELRRVTKLWNLYEPTARAILKGMSDKELNAMSGEPDYGGFYGTVVPCALGALFGSLIFLGLLILKSRS